MPLGDAQFRGVDVMKHTKDLVNNQENDATIENIVDVLASMNLTHISHAVPINATAEYAGANTPAPRTVENFYKKWCDTIHAKGLKVLHRGTLNGIEGIWGFQWQVGGNRYPAGSYDEVIAPTFLDDFFRASLGPDWQTGHQAGNSWNIVANELVGPVADGWRRTCLTVRLFKDFTATATIEKIGNQQIVVRATTDPNFPGYGFQIRDDAGGQFRLERPGLSTLASVPKTFTPNALYSVKVQAAGNVVRGKVWLDGSPEPGAWDIEFTDVSPPAPSYLQAGFIGFSGESNNGHFDSILITPVPDYNSHIGKVYQWIINNPASFENGDLWAVLPERTENIFSDLTSFLPHTPPGIQQRYVDFFTDMRAVSEQAFQQIGKPGVLCGYTANNYSEVASGWIPQSYFSPLPSAGVVVDHYGVTHTVAEMESDLRGILASRGEPVFLQEWGDYWNSAMDPIARLQYLSDMYTMLGQLVDEGVLTGFNYWGGWTGNQEGLLQGTAPNYSLNDRGLLLKEFFQSAPVPPPPPPEPPAIIERLEFFEPTSRDKINANFLYLYGLILAEAEGVGFSDNEIPAGAVNGVNNSFTLAHAPVTGSLQLFRNGILQIPGTNYTIAGTGITFTNPPLTGNSIRGFYRYLTT